MKTVKFSDILTQTCQLVGLDIDTLNTKSFNVIRDLATRRLSQVWDREEWPDTQRHMNTYPGIPISYVKLNDDQLLTEDGLALVTEDNYFISWNLEWQTILTLVLDETFPTVYLKDFSDNLYNLGTIETSKITILNPFYIDGKDVNDFDYTFTLSTIDNNDGNGPFVVEINIIFNTQVQIYSVDYAKSFNTYQLANQKLTATLVFNLNKQLLVKLDNAELQGIEIFNNDPRVTTRCIRENFIVEDFDNKKTELFVLSENSSFLRVFNTGEKFVRYRIPATRLFGSVFNSLLSYTIGDQVYYNGEFWNCIAASTSNEPESSSQYWENADIPYRFRDFLVNATSCDFLRSEARFEEAEVLNNMAEVAVQQQIDVLLRQQGQVQRMNMAYTY
tara:strand:+ start:1534 stop:2700 length:1167 start_codon:yes stop_codon:yes gene_type:complete